MIPVSQRLVAPVELATAHENAAVARKQNTSRACSKGLSGRTSRRSNTRATTGSSVLPAAIKLDATKPARVDGSVNRLARKAPTVIPGHTRRPKTSTAASPIPDGGHTGEAFVPGNCIHRPSRAPA